MGPLGSNGMAGRFVTGLTSDLRRTQVERERRWVVLFPAWPEPDEGEFGTCTLGARRCSRTKGEKGNVRWESSMTLYTV